MDETSNIDVSHLLMVEGTGSRRPRKPSSKLLFSENERKRQEERHAAKMAKATKISPPSVEKSTLNTGKERF